MKHTHAHQLRKLTGSLVDWWRSVSSLIGVPRGHRRFPFRQLDRAIPAPQNILHFLHVRYTALPCSSSLLLPCPFATDAWTFRVTMCVQVLMSEWGHIVSHLGLVPKGHALDLANATLGERRGEGVYFLASITTRTDTPKS